MFRPRILGLAGTLALLGADRTPGQENPPSPPTFPAAVELVTVDAVVVDREGRPVPGLTRDDFVISEDGKPLEIARFEAFVAEPTEPALSAPSVLSSNEAGARGNGRAFAILIDDLRIPPVQDLDARRTAASFLERSVRDGDEVTFGTTSGDAWWSARIPEGREDLLAVLGRVKGKYVQATSLYRMTDYEAFWINTHESSPSIHPLLPDRPASAPAAAPTPEINPLGASVKERVKQRWKDLNLCSGTSCEGMVRDQATDIDVNRRSRTELTLRAVRRGLDALAPIRGRKSLLLLSEGFIDDSETDVRGVEAASREANTAVYFIDTRGLVALPGGGSAADAEPLVPIRDRLNMGFEDAVLESAGAVALAEETGGFSIRNNNDLAGGADRIAEESRVFYLLGFYPPEGKSTRAWRKLRVEVKRSGLKVRARRGYTLRVAAAPGETKPGKKGKKPTLDPVVIQALDSAHEAAGIPLRIMTYVFEPRPNGTTHVLVGAEFDGSRLGVEGKGKTRAGRLELSILASHRDSGKEFRFDETLALAVAAGEAPAWRGLAREFELPSGVAQARVVVRDPTSGAIGSVSQRFEVPPAGVLRLATPILTDHIEPAGKAPSHPRPALAVHRVFRPQGALYIQFEVLGAARTGGSALPRVSAGLALKTGDGRLVRQAPSTPITVDPDGRVVRFVGLPLDGLQEGPYDLLLEVQDDVSGARLERHEPFSLAREAGAP
ncbi:MAG TPA: VWA domain-containing protein [Vicinamibacteria bacterium]|nr:VWA domain-containing protein [Vicinamibacteria bacterium]